MSLKAELETWSAALKAYDEEQFEESLQLFSTIADSSKILTNMGLIHATLGDHEQAVEHFNAATQLDQYLAIAYFQCGVSNFLLGQYELALKDFEEALLYLRGNQAINYDQLGLKYRLYSAEVLFNKGLCLVYMGAIDDGLREMEDAKREKATDEHNVIDDAIKDKGEGYTVFSIPVGIVYRPPANKIKNAKAKDYLGKAKLVAAADVNDAYTTFTGVTRLKQGITPTGAPLLDRPPSDPSPVPPPVNLPTRSKSANATLVRSGTQINVGTRTLPSPTAERRPSLNVGGGMPSGPGMTRALSVKKGSVSPSAVAPGPPPPPKQQQQDSGITANPARLTEIYDDYIDGYAEPDVATMPEGAGGRVAAWAKQSAQPATAARRAPSMYNGSSAGGSMKRRLTRRTTYGANSRRGPMSTYDEDEDGYGSGEFEDGPWEMTKIKLKIHYNSDIRGMALDPLTPFDEFLDRLSNKFNKSFSPGEGLTLKFKDEDGTQVSLRDESDYELAIETAREHAKGKPEGKLEIWAEDV